MHSSTLISLHHNFIDYKTVDADIRLIVFANVSSHDSYCSRSNLFELFWMGYYILLDIMVLSD